ncbi:aspartate/glutamate racemase family protein [Ancylobacter terrae]|uniref:aspartate/glutamate racemase family protein n=1 Tax=Ancylobacter sp. sgz301288 TaxID=3342077 RepID=UPI00385B3221
MPVRAKPRILLVNPNTSHATTDMMVAIAQEAFAGRAAVVGVTAARGVSMILDEAALGASVGAVIEATGAAEGYEGVIVSAFGDPGLAELRARLEVPVAGICEASMREAAEGGRRFGIATVTPLLVDIFARKAAMLGIGDSFVGTRLTTGDPLALAADPVRLEAELAHAVAASIAQDRAEAVIIGGGPLGQAAIGLAGRYPVPVIAPIPCAVRALTRDLGLPAA